VRARLQGATRWTGAMTVDVEEAYHAAALATVAPRRAWPDMESRVAGTTSRILDLFAAASVRGTFFVLGTVARDHPGLVLRILSEGHELASHGWSHYRVTEQSPAAFRADVAQAKAALEDAGGVEVRGYRAANFSIDQTTWWAYDILAETGHSYSSSINPVRHDHYGLPDAPRVPFSPAPRIVELPMTTVLAGGRRLPVSGGGWFRLLPYAVSVLGLERAARAGLRPIFYFHPWEIDPGQPRLPAPLKSRFRHYVNLGAMERKIARLARAASWDRLDRLHADVLSTAPATWRPARVADHPVAPVSSRKGDAHAE
jgi:polysaccharide deacetylase family protein (PEP-CTERM system associated)